MRSRILYIIVFIIIASNQIVGQKVITPNLYVSPFITIGYTIGAGMNYGFDITFGLFKVLYDNPEINAAISFQYYFINYNKSLHIVKTINLIAENQYFRIGYGMGEVKKSWGFKKRNQSKAFGSAIDFGVTTYSYKTPYFGLKIFVPRKGTWEWCQDPFYVSIYTYFRQEPYYLYK
jgi:hypothetical protein